MASLQINLKNLVYQRLENFDLKRKSVLEQTKEILKVVRLKKFRDPWDRFVAACSNLIFNIYSSCVQRVGLPLHCSKPWYSASHA